MGELRTEPTPDGVPPDPLLAAVQTAVLAPPAQRPDVWSGVEAAAQEARGRRAWSALADAAEMLARLGESDADARERAVALVTPVVASQLIDRLRAPDTSPARREALRSVLPALGPEVEEALLQALRDEAVDPATDHGRRRALLGAVAEMADRGSDILVRMAAEPDWRVARNAAQMLGERGGPEVLARLRPLTRHPDARVRREALSGLARTGEDEVGVLAKVLLEDPDVGVRVQAARTVGLLGVGLAVRPLIALLEREEDAGVVQEALRALGMLGDPAAVPALERLTSGSLLSRGSQEARVAAYRALGAIGSPRALELVRDALADRDAEVRRTAQAVLGPDA
ncbi:MAG: HEAT repeat domain-containing protein [Longimicrobiales bacterium]|nr:HEAT repeat domain-containing protein [Longimicrobiales bacterium]